MASQNGWPGLASFALLPDMPMDGSGLDKPQHAEQANKQVNKWD